MTRSELRTDVRSNLSDAGITFYQDQDINNSLQDAYNNICAYCQCIVKSVTLNWLSNVNYYDFLNGNVSPTTGQPQNVPVSDYLGTIGIFSNTTNLWLRDDLNIRDFDKIRIDWELWTGQSQYWTPHSLKYIVVVPCLPQGVGNFVLWYWGQAPLFVEQQDTTQEVVIANDMQNLFEYFATADLLESAEEPTKAMIWWQKYFEDRESYKERCRDNARADLLQRI
jgi:hypothetical protein